MQNFFRDCRRLGRLIWAKLRTPKFGQHTSIPLLVEKNAVNCPNDPALSCDLEQLTWSEFNQRANRVSSMLKSQGVKKGDSIALLVENRCEYLVFLIGICKIGAIAALLNTQQRREILSHSIELVQAKKLIFGEELTESVAEVTKHLKELGSSDLLMITDRNQHSNIDWAQRVSSQDQQYSATNPTESQQQTTSDTALYIFTSGTTGLPKAGIASHRRWLQASQGFAKGLYNASKDDRIYNCLPLCHATALMVGFGPTVIAACSTVLRRKFSASGFFDDIRNENCNTFIYIGEMCRYLMNTPVKNDDHDNPLVKCAGNGMRPDIWLNFKDRFAIEGIHELYGASDGNTVFINTFNKDCSIGLCISPIVVAKYDTDCDDVVRDKHGLCIPVSDGEPGLLLGEISNYTPFEGYTNKQASDSRVLRNVKKPGDQYLNMGDLIKSIDVGFSFGLKHYQFVDRTGDSFRWRGENCSTNEIAEIINHLDIVNITNIYGVEIPNTEGRAGMAAICFNHNLAPTEEQIDWEKFSNYISDELPIFARPVFVRIQTDINTTETHKLVKNHLKEQAYHLDKVGADKIFVLKPRTDYYQPLDNDFYQRILSGQAGF